ncbi:hypothetical protein B0E37_01973 [Streptomyces sp. MH192]|nr:hypothetical protein [Streptomyces sp. MH192]MCF0099300.1 hypothetical protein [Streptomyces sp. MH191]
MTYGWGIRGIMNRQPVSELRSARSRAGRGGDVRLRCGLDASDLRSVPEVRRELRELLDGRAERDRCAVAELLTSELVANALVHTDREAVVTAVVSGRGLRVEVRDFAERGPVPRSSPVREETEADRERTHGRGLLLVRALADAWGVRAHEVGKSVWFELTDLAAGPTDDPTAGAADGAAGEAAARRLPLDGDAA